MTTDRPAVLERPISKIATLLILHFLLASNQQSKAGEGIAAFRFFGRSPMRTKTCGTLLFITDHSFDRADELSLHLAALERQIRRVLDLPTRSVSARIHIFRNHRAYHSYLRKNYPSFGAHIGTRRSIFLLRDGMPHIFAVRGKDMLRDLRHEYCHAILNTSIHGLPIWVDEGIAEYFEIGDRSSGQQAHLELLRRKIHCGWRSNLGRLEQMEDFRQMENLEYAEAWSWIDFLLGGSQEVSGMLPSYLSDLRFGAEVPTIRARLVEKLGNPEKKWREHVKKMIANDQ